MTEKIALVPETHTDPRPRSSAHGVKEEGNILQVAYQVGFLPHEEGQAPRPRGPAPCASGDPRRPSPTSRRSWKRATPPGTT